MTIATIDLSAATALPHRQERTRAIAARLNALYPDGGTSRDAIVRHRLADAAFSAALHTQNKLEAELPKEKRKWRCEWNDSPRPVPADDDPRWIENQRDADIVGSAAAKAVVDVVSRKPADVHELNELLRYVLENEERGEFLMSETTFTGEYDGDDEPVYCECKFAFLESIKAAVSDLAKAQCDADIAARRAVAA